MRFILMLATIFILSGCATMPENSSTPLDIVEQALTERASELEARILTEGGESQAKAQYALGIIYQYGLNGTPRDVARAAQFKSKATSMRGYLPITQYIPGLNGAPGLTHIINVPKYDLSIGQARRVDICVKALNVGQQNNEANVACGGREAFISLYTLWRAAMNGSLIPQ
jgi:hypothetical protein